jgi:hypothetical protein
MVRLQCLVNIVVVLCINIHINVMIACVAFSCYGFYDGCFRGFRGFRGFLFVGCFCCCVSHLTQLSAIC